MTNQARTRSCSRPVRFTPYGFSIGRMPPNASETQEKLLDAAARAFAEEGVFNASMIGITRRAGQRNRSALNYHFGSREGVLCAVLERHVDFLARARR